MSSRFTKLRKEVIARRKNRSHVPQEITVALDVMGSEAGPLEMLKGAYEAVKLDPLISVICVGDGPTLKSVLSENKLSHPRLTIQHSDEVIGMKELPNQAVKKKNSSIAICAGLVHSKVAHAVVSPGNTGVTMATCMLQWKRLPGISRPAIATVLPHPKRPCLILDVGANVDCKARHLYHFGLMGSVYTQAVLHRRNPRVGILSNGEEECKGSDLIRETYSLLKVSNLNFKGNAEGRDLMAGTFDVVVCDGLMGNVVLKFGEGLAEFIMTNLKDEILSNLISKLGALAIFPALRNFKKQVDHAEYGGAPLLGLNGTCVICHGSSRAKAIKNAIRVAKEQVSMSVNEKILKALKDNQEAEALSIAPPKVEECNTGIS